MTAANKCRVDECDRNAASSIIRDHLPGPLPLCLTHTEDFRMNGEAWTIVWERTAPEPSSVTIAPLAPTGHSGPRPADAVAASTGVVPGLRSRLSMRRKKSA
jgi:hypothetical protein